MQIKLTKNLFFTGQISTAIFKLGYSKDIYYNLPASKLNTFDFNIYYPYYDNNFLSSAGLYYVF